MVNRETLSALSKRPQSVFQAVSDVLESLDSPPRTRSILGMQAASSFLNRKVLRRSLPSIKGKPPAGAPVLKRLLLDQGELAHFWDGDEPIRYMAFLELRAGALRGNHYHKNKREFFYLSSGKVLLRLLDPDTRASETLELNTGDLVDIAVGVAHAFEVLAEGHAVEFAPQKFDVEDVYACDVTTLVSG